MASSNLTTLKAPKTSYAELPLTQIKLTHHPAHAPNITPPRINTLVPPPPPPAVTSTTKTPSHPNPSPDPSLHHTPGTQSKLTSPGAAASPSPSTAATPPSSPRFRAPPSASASP